MCHLQEAYAKYKDKGLVILGFDCADDKKIALDMLRANGATFPNVIDPSAAALKVCFEQYQKRGRSAVPMSYLIDGKGVILDAWYGGHEEHPRAMKVLLKTGGKLAAAIRQDWDAKAKDVAAAAERLFKALRTADYNYDWTKNGDWKWFPAKDVQYIARDRAGWVPWVCKKFRDNPITDVQLGKVVAGADGKPTLSFELHLKNGQTLRGKLSFLEDAKTKQWVGWQGLDWHVRRQLGDGWWDKLVPPSK